MPRPDHAAGAAAVQDPPSRPGASAGAPEQVVTLLARAVQRHHAYPAASPLCEEAITACQRAFALVRTRETVTFRLLPGRLLLDDAPLQSAALAGAELSRRLRRAGVASLTIDREVTARELARFCREVVRRDHLAADAEPLGDVLSHHGVEKIQVTVVHRPAVLDVGAPDPAHLNVLTHERERRARADLVGTPIHLYPPEKGWVRVDPTSGLSEASLLDLVLLVQDPPALAAMLIRLSEETPPADPAEALSEKVEEIASLIHAMDPMLAEQLFARLARSVLSLGAARRQQLLRDSLLPGLLEGRADGAVLRHFPDLELTEALTLLLDVHVAAPELLASALDRLQLPEDRRDRLQPLVQQRLAERRPAEGADDAALHPGEIDGFTEGQIRIDHREGKSFREFTAHDLAVDDTTRARLAAIADEVAATDPLIARTRCVRDVLMVESNPDTASELAALAGRLLAELRDRPDPLALAAWVGAFRALESAALEDRPDLARELHGHLSTLPTPGLVHDLARLAEDQSAGVEADLLGAFGDLIVPALVTALADADDRGRRAIVRLLSPHAAVLAPALAQVLDGTTPQVARALLQAIGDAAAGLEAQIAPLTGHGDEHLAREAFRALARAGTPAALAAIAGVLTSGGPRLMLAEEAFWRLPPALARAEARRLLGDRPFVTRHPELARSMLGRLADHGPADAAAVAPALAVLRFHFWRPARVRLGLAATALTRRNR